jgi:acyl CoA:acetate/3-ketoacid CoA transferase
LTPEGVELFELAPGVDLQRDVLEQMDFVPRLAQPVGMMPAAYFTALDDGTGSMRSRESR